MTMDKHTTWLAYIWALISGICAQWTLNDYGALIGIVLGIGTFLVNKHYKKKSEQAQARQAAAMEERNRLIARILEKNDHDSTLKMLAVPSVKFAGLSPTGLNASSEGEIRVFYDTIAALATRLLKKPLKKVLDIIQLSEFGDIDPDITFEFEPLHELTREQLANIRKTEAETDQIYESAGAVTNNEVRERLATAPDSPYSGIDLSGEIEIDDTEENPPQDPNADPETDFTQRGD